MGRADKATIEFDHHSAEYAEDWRGKAREMHSGCPVAWTEAHGGHWVMADYEAVKKASMDTAIFSSFNDVEGGPGSPKGILIPPNPYQLTLNEQDPPDSTKRRMIEAPLFTPRQMERWVKRAEVHLEESITSIKAKGGGDFVMDLAMAVPAKTTLNLVGVDEAEWKDYALPAHLATKLPGNHPDYPMAALMDISQRLANLVIKRRDDPRDDMATQMANATIDGKPLEIEVAAGMLLTLATGGFDTATSLLCHSLIWLGDHREVWPTMLESQKTMDNGVAELLRYFPPSVGTARNVVEDIEVCGQHLAKGERIMMSWAGANYDPKKFENPEEIRVDRPNAQDHVSFGAGPHRCLGSPLARAELRMVLEAAMRELPTYRVLKDQVSQYDRVGVVNGYNYVPFVLD